MPDRQRILRPSSALRRWLIAALVLAASLAGGAEAAPEEPKEPRDPPLGTLLVLGDSYSELQRAGIKSWSEQLQDAGAVRLLANLATSGTRAEGKGGPRTFAGQVDAWLQRHGGRNADTTVVYLGYNDIKGTNGLATAKASYTREVDRLIRAGATDAGRRLLLVLLHDWSRNPGVKTSKRDRVREWNRHIVAVAQARPRVAIVDLFALFESVFAAPGRYGLTNLARADHRGSFTTALFADSAHFGERGQAIVARAIKSALTRDRRRSYRVTGAAAFPSRPEAA
jgi:phospholipase/lecithinase/hemolysin